MLFPTVHAFWAPSPPRRTLDGALRPSAKQYKAFSCSVECVGTYEHAKAALEASNKLSWFSQTRKDGA